MPELSSYIRFWLPLEIKKPQTLEFTAKIKVDDGTRTRDLLTTNEVRYHLCHISLCV